MRQSWDSAARTSPRTGQEVAIVLKSPREIELIRSAGRVVRRVLDTLQEVVRPGVTTGELGRVAAELITSAGGQGLFRGVNTNKTRFAFPAPLCARGHEEEP